MNPCILVFGLPRSGTTWIGKLFDSNPDTLYRHEPDSLRRLSLPLFPEKEDASGYREELEKFVALLPELRSPEVVGKLPLFPKSYQSAASLAVYRASVGAAKAASRIRRHAPCLYRPTGADHMQTRVVWKSIESSGRLGACVEALPEVRAIHLMRHPCGVMASILRGAKAHGFGQPTTKAGGSWLLKRLLVTATGKAHGLEEKDIQQLTPEEQAAWRWVLTQEKILADVAHCERVLTVRYEDVCADAHAMTQQMFQFAGLDWHQQTERFVRASTEVTSTDYYSVFKNPQASAERWRSELAPDVIERVLRILRNSSLSHFYPDDAQTSAALPKAAV